MKYTIEFNYNTGNSFNSESLTDTLEHWWTDIDTVRLNFNRIKEQYAWYLDKATNSRFREKEIERPSWLPKKEDLTVYQDERSLLVLKMDNGNPWMIRPIWCGYFEALNSIRIITDISDEHIF